MALATSQPSPTPLPPPTSPNSSTENLPTTDINSPSASLCAPASDPTPTPTPLPKAESVRVVIQSRPLLPFELAHNARRAVTVTSKPPVISVSRPRTAVSAANSDFSSTDTNSDFSCFDAVYDAAPGSQPNALYDTHVSPLVTTLFTGVNATVFAYGQTCAGKSYTMRHVTTRVAAHIFREKRRVESEGTRNVTVRVGFVEIYRETIRDLVDGASAPLGAVHVHVRAARTGSSSSKSKKQGVFLDGARERCVDSERELLDIVEEGALVRRTAATGMNACSSRSHSIITVSVIQEGIDGASSDKSKCLYGKVHLVDLAGSERAKRTAVGGERFAEGVDINKGLFALAKVISTLADNSRKPVGRKAHVPYRDSKLTRLLQDSLGGNARTVLIACVSPADSSAEETLGTLRYAERARHIRNKPKVNKDANAVEISDLRAALSRARAEIARLAAENERLRAQKPSYPASVGKQEDKENEDENQVQTGSPRQLQPIATTSLSSPMRRSTITAANNDRPQHFYQEQQQQQRPQYNRRLPQRSRTMRERTVNQRQPLTSTRLPRRRAEMSIGKRKPRSPSTGALRRRSQSVSALRTRGANSVSNRNSSTEGLRKQQRTTKGRRSYSQNREDVDASMSDSESSTTDDYDEDEDYEEEDNELKLEKKLRRSAACALTESRFEEMRRTFTERLQQCETDKAALDAERNRLLQSSREMEEKHAKEIENLKNDHVIRVNKLRARIADVKRLEAESTRLSKLRDGSDAARKKLQGRVVAAERSRDEMVSKLNEALSKTEVSNLHLGKENRVLVRCERQLRMELQRAIDARAKVEHALTRLRQENEAMRSRLTSVTPGNPRTTSSVTIRRVNSSYTPAISVQHAQPHRQTKGLRD